MNTRLGIDVKPKNIQTLVKELNTGKYFLPSFQRQYVWDEDDIKDLIDSISKNYPIGNIILWKPSSESLLDLDPFSKPLINLNENTGKERYYVIDGQQRLTSLLLLLNNWEIERDGEKIKCDPICYNPSNKKFYKSKDRGIDLSELIKAFYYYDVNAISKLKKETPEEFHAGMQDMIQRLLNEYQVPVYIMETEKEDEETFQDMAEAFIRVNKYGVRIGNLELMLSFLAGSVRGDLKKRIRDLYEEIYKDFKIDLQPVIRFAFSNFDLKQTQISNVNQFKRNVKKIADFDTDKTTEVFKKCEKSMKCTIQILKDELGIGNSSLLPSQMPIVTIAKYLYNREIESVHELSASDKQKIIDWFVLTSFNGYYSSQTNSKLDKDLECVDKAYFDFDELIRNQKSKRERIKVSENDIKKGLELNVLRHQGRAYLFMLYVILVKNKADDWKGTLLSQQDISELARHHIFPKDFLDRNLETEEPDVKERLINNLGNITFIHQSINSELEDTSPEDYMESYRSATIKHFVPTDKHMWSINQYKTFLEYRINEIYHAGKKYFPDIFQ